MEPVLIYLSAIDQPDSIGFNLVESLNKLLYPRIKNGDIALWKTSSKKELINKIQSLFGLETISESMIIHVYMPPSNKVWFNLSTS